MVWVLFGWFRMVFGSFWMVLNSFGYLVVSDDFRLVESDFGWLRVVLDGFSRFTVLVVTTALNRKT